MDMELLAGLIAIIIGFFGVCACLIRYSIIKLGQLLDSDDDEGYF